MDKEPSPYLAMIQRCEAAIARIRAARRAGNTNSDAVGQDWIHIRQAVRPRLARYAMAVRNLAPEAADEALEAMLERLLYDVLSPGYVSLETQFGAYLNSMPKRVVFKMRRKYIHDNASFMMERLDADSDEDGQSMHETLADPRAEQPFAAIGEREALSAVIARLPDADRHVVVLRLQGYENNAIAQLLGVSPATASRIYQRAISALRQQLGQVEE